MKLVKLGLAIFIVGMAVAASGGIASARHATPDDNFPPVCTNPSNAGGHHQDIGDPGHSGGPGNGTGKDCSKAATVTPKPTSHVQPKSTPKAGVQGVSTTVPGTGGESYAGYTVAGFLLLGGIGFVLTGLLRKTPLRR
jgi:hypothetical protein